jgi:hypothetical protein
VSGAQLEISATIKFGSASASASGGEFGLAVLSGEVDGVAEHTKIGFNLTASQVYIDRRNSSTNRTDFDVRAGPMPTSLATTGQLSFHAYVDHSLVTVIVENQTALTVWVHPASAKSTGVALFTASGEGVTLESMEVFELNGVANGVAKEH